MAQMQIDILSHLFEVERQASDVIMAAQTQADKKIAIARAKSDEDFNTQYEALCKEKDEALALQKANVDAGCKKELDAYEKELRCQKENQAEFDKVLTQILHKTLGI